ncbi:MAG: AAA family ATPase [Anaerolineae bacterium]|nr:AAA family ATPase [Anaerolineae bacterium]
MSGRLARLDIRNFRSLADLSVELGAVNVLFGPNGAGKSTFLDALCFVRDCFAWGVDAAASFHNHGIGALWNEAGPGANVSIRFETPLAEYEILFGYSSGRIEPFVGEKLRSKDRDIYLIDRKIGSDKAMFWHTKDQSSGIYALREPERLALNRYLDFAYTVSPAASEINNTLASIYFYHLRHIDIIELKKSGSESIHHIELEQQSRNLWSVLRNIHDRRSFDERYDTIVGFMRKSFPEKFRDLLLEQTPGNKVYGNVIEIWRTKLTPAIWTADGYIQMLALLTALFSQDKSKEALIMFDEPETSLHPHAIAVFAEAVKLAVSEWNRQVIIATHSPVLISQFEPEDLFAVEIGERGQTVMTRLSEIEDIQDLLEQYAAGSLYMAEAIAPQSKPFVKAESE